MASILGNEFRTLRYNGNKDVTDSMQDRTEDIIIIIFKKLIPGDGQ